MNLIQMECKNCGSQLDLDLNNIQAFCPYCGVKLMIDSETLSKVLSEKERTRQIEVKEQEETKRQEANHKAEIKKDILSFILPFGALLLLLLLLILFLVLSFRSDS